MFSKVFIYRGVKSLFGQEDPYLMYHNKCKRMPVMVAEKNVTNGLTDGQTDGRTERGKSVYPPLFFETGVYYIKAACAPIHPFQIVHKGNFRLLASFRFEYQLNNVQSWEMDDSCHYDNNHKFGKAQNSTNRPYISNLVYM